MANDTIDNIVSTLSDRYKFIAKNITYSIEQGRNDAYVDDFPKEVPQKDIAAFAAAGAYVIRHPLMILKYALSNSSN